MRSIAATVVLAGMMVHAVAAFGSSACLKEKILEPSDRCHSSYPAQVKTCLTNQLDSLTQEALQSCFIQAGCEELDAKFEAQWVVESCPSQSELRVRPRDDEENHKEKTTTTEKATKTTATEEKGGEKTTKEPSETKTTPSEPTTEDKETTKSDPEPTSTTVIPTTVTESTGTSTQLAQETSSTLSAGGSADLGAVQSLTCFTTITFTTEGFELVTTASSGRPTRTFNSQMVAVRTRCADGMLCRGETCMEADNSLSGSGIAVAIFFATAAAVSLVTLIVLCCRDRRRDKQLRERAEAAKMAREAAKPVVAVATTRAVSAGRRSPAGSDRQPLVHQGMYPPSPIGSQGRPSHDHFSDKRRL